MWRPAAALFLVALLCGFAYSNSLHGGFHYDDFRGVLDDASLSDGTLGAIWDAHLGPRVLSHLTFALNYRFGGLSDGVLWHVTNVLLHVLVACSLYVALTLISTQALALSAAALFAVHPSVSEPVNYLIARPMLLTALGALWALVGVACRRPWGWALCASGLLLAGLSKEVGLFYGPLAVALYVLVWRSTRRISPVVGALIVGGVVLGSGWMLSGDGYIEYILTAARSFWHMVLFTVPTRLWLCVDHFAALAPVDLAHVGALVGIIGLVGLAFWLRPRERVLSLGIFWSIAGMAPYVLVASGPEHFVEYRLYFSFLGMTTLCAWTLVQLRPPWLRWCTLGLFVTFSLLQTRARNEVWRSELSLWQDAAEKHPDNPRAHNNLGLAFHSLGRWDEATEHLREAVRLEPRLVMAHNNLGNALAQKGDLDAAAAAYQQALDLDATLDRTLNNLGNVRAQQGRLDEAIELYRRALAIDPQNSEARINLERVLQRERDQR